MCSFPEDRAGQPLPRPAGYYHFLDDRRKAIVQAIRSGKRPSLWRISIHVLSSCTLECNYCKVRRCANKLVAVTGRTEWLGRQVPRCVSSEELRALIDAAAVCGAKHLHLTGGEPTIVDDLPDLVALASRLGFSISLVTNGASPNAASPKYRADLLRAGVGSVSISLDSADPRLSDSLSGVPGAHAQTVDFTKQLVAERSQCDSRSAVQVYLQMVVDRNSIFGLLDNVAYAGTLGVDDMRILLVKGHRERWLTEDDWRRFRAHYADHVIKAAKALGFRMLLEDISAVFMDDEMLQYVTQGCYYRPFRGPCYISTSEFTVASNGDVYPCAYHYWDGDSNPYANVLMSGIPDVLASMPAPPEGCATCLSACTRHLVDTNRAIHQDLDGLAKSPRR